MAKKKIEKIVNEDEVIFTKDEHIANYKPVIETDLEDQVQTSMIDYGEYIIEKRAIPSALDGLKPSQRRSIYTFKHENVIGQKVKLARISGACIGNFHPHGDVAINDTIANMTQPWKNNFSFFTGSGTWGSIAGDRVAAARYVEITLNRNSEDLLFEHLNKDGVVSWQKNYDDRLDEPVILPVKYPIHLINGSSGIAYSMSTSIPSYNILEMTKLFIYMINNQFWKDSWILDEHKAEILNIIQGPDLPTGANIYFTKNTIHDTVFNPSFSFNMRANYELYPEDNLIMFTNIPTGVTTEKIKEEIIDLALDYKIVKDKNTKKERKEPKLENEILQLKSSEPIEIIINKNKTSEACINLIFKDNADLNVELVKLLTNTSLDMAFGANMNVINAEGVPELMSFYRNIRLFLYFRRHVIYQAFLSEINKLKEQIMLLNGLLIALSEKDKFIKIVTTSDKVREDLMLSFVNLNEQQIDYLLDMKVNKLTKLGLENTKNDIIEKEELVKEKHKLIESSDSIFEYIKNDYEKLLTSNLLKPYTRNSEILSDVRKITFEDTIEDENVILMLMNDETIGIVPKSTYKVRNRGSQLKDSKIDQDGFGLNVKTLYDGKLKDELFFITNKGRILKQSIWKFSKKFINIRNYLNLQNDENVINMINTADLDNKNIIIITNLMIKNIPLEVFKNVTANSGKIAIDLKENDTVKVILINDKSKEEDIIILSADGKVLKFAKESIKEIKSGSSIGSRIISKKYKVLDSFLIEKETDSALLLISDIGKGKKVEIADISMKKIGQSPNNVFENNEKNGNLIKGIILDNNADEVITLISENGNVSMLKIKEELRTVSRTAKGAINLLNNKDGEKIVFACKNKNTEEKLEDIDDENASSSNEDVKDINLVSENKNMDIDNIVE